jgi:hypothetical protein
MQPNLTDPIRIVLSQVALSYSGVRRRFQPEDKEYEVGKCHKTETKYKDTDRYRAPKDQRLKGECKENKEKDKNEKDKNENEKKKLKMKICKRGHVRESKERRAEANYSIYPRQNTTRQDTKALQANKTR